MGTSLRILFIGESSTQSRPAESHLCAHGLTVEARGVNNREGLAAALQDAPWDVVVADGQIPNLAPEAILLQLRSLPHPLPLVLLSDRVGEERVIEWLQQGAVDVVLKDNLARLVPAIERSVGEASDRGARRRAEEALTRLHRQTELILNASAEGILGLDLEDRHIFVNPAAARMLGYTVEELLDRPAHVTWHHTQADGRPYPREECRIRAALSGVEMTRVSDEVFWRKDGTCFPVDYACTPIIERGQVRGAVVSFSDITERRQAERALHTSEARLQDAQAVAHIGSWHLDLSCQSLTWSAETCRIFGRSDAPRTYAEFLECIHPDDQEILDQAWRAAQAGAPFNLRHRIVAGNEVKWVHQRAALDHERGGKATGYVGTVQDITELTLAEEALRRSENEFRATFEMASIGMAQADLRTGQWLRVNQKMCAITGYSAEEMLRMRVPEITHPDDRERDWQMFQRVVRGEEPNYHLEKRYVRKDGSVAWVRVNMTLLRGADGQPWRTIATVEDITDRKRVETALRESEHLRQTVLDLVPHFIFAKDRQGRYLFANRACAMANGRTPEEMIGHGDEELIPDRAEATAFRQDDQQVIDSGQPKFIPEERLTNEQGQVRILQTTKIPFIGPGGEPAVMGVSVDVTNLKETEAALRFHQELLQETGRIAMVGGWEFDPLTGQGTWTEEVARIHDLDPGAQTSVSTGLSFYVSESRSKIEAAIRDAVERGQPYDLELEMISARGVRKAIRTIGRPVMHEGKVVKVQGSFQDITALKQLEAQVRQGQKLEAIGQLAGGVAHDFNNILAAFMMQLNLLQMNPTLDESARQAVDDLEAEAMRAANLTRQLLMFSRRSVLAMKPVDLNEVMGNLLKMLRRLIGENIDLRVEGRANLPWVEADAGMMEQVLMNLIVNARDAMPKGGRVTIRTEGVEVSAAEAAASASRRPGRFVSLTVTDTGCGMDAETLKRVFDPFFTTKEVGKGTGLGLATVHGIVSQHKGWVEVESELGAGTTFLVFLPAITRAAAKAAVAATAEPVRGGRETILLVEDETKVRRLIAQALRVLGYQVFEAGTGQEAMTLWQTHAPKVDLLLTDMIMPEGVTGLELIEQLQAQKPGLKAIITSGYSSEITQAGVPNRKGVVYLPKPYAAKTLAEVVRNCLDSRA